MDLTILSLLDSIPQKSPRSKLETDRELIRQLRRKGCTYRDIVRILHERVGLDVAVSTIHSFIKVRAKHRKQGIRARILSNSFLEVLCFWASLFANKFVQVTLGSSHKMLAPLQNGCQEMIMRLHLLTKFFLGIDRGIHFPPEALLRVAQCRRQVSKTSFADDHQIYVTRRMLPVSRNGAVDKSTLDFVSEGLQYLLHNRNESCGFLEQLLQFSEYRGSGLCFEVGPCTFTAVR